MKTVGIITEFNPFHKGHEYIIKEAKKQTGADYCIIVTSGNFVQRGEPSFIDKYTKTTVALKHGADLVIEMPFQFSTSSAEYFAMCGVSILNSLKIVDYLAFGVENEDLNVINNIADILNNEQSEFKHILKRSLANGDNYATARAYALKKVMSDDNMDFLSRPNNILALEYIKALKKLNSTIKPIGIKRIIADYHESFSSEISQTEDVLARLYSGSNLRALNDEKVIKLLSKIDPLYVDKFSKSYPIRLRKSFSSIAGIKLLEAISKGNNDYFDVSPSLYDKIKKNIYQYQDYTSFIKLLKTKEISYTAISRGLLHMILGITKHDIEYLRNNNYGNYIRVLGFKKEAACILTEIKNNSSLTIITKTSNYKNELHPAISIHFTKGIHADDLYRMCTVIDLKSDLPNEFTHKLITL